ncbi:PH domain-containing protein [Rhodothermus profundi]|uniref:Putative membrane protein n=1 Tax=Rhodothermus profundi TaxID=633813 RepID=A0A1M6TGG4_9BACT|nr:PH domain-containing protein [Rhodothermus profundi]SHK55868.1 putative membrane protein [Rhodothermus profundi]
MERPSEASIETPQFRRLHPLTLLVRLLMSLPAFLVLLFPALQGQTVDRWTLFMMMLYGLLALPLILAHYLRFRYALTPRELIIESGVLTHRRRSIPIDRIQNVQIERTLLARMLGLARVRIETAGSTETEGEIAFVSLPEAQRLKEQVHAFRRGAIAEQELEPTRALLFSMTLGQLLHSGAFRFSLVYLAGMFSVMEYLKLTPEELIDWIVRGQLHWVQEAFEQTPLLAAAATLLLAALLGWGAGIVVHVVRFYGFQLWKEGERFYRRSGLFTVAESVVPKRRIQALVIRTNPLMQRFGWYVLEAQLMGLDREAQKMQTLVPFGRADTIQQIAAHVWPLHLPSAWHRVSPRMIQRVAVRYLLVGTGLLLGIGWIWPEVRWLLIGLPVGAPLMAWLQYRRHGYALQGAYLFVRQGVFRHRIWCLPYQKMQVFSLTRSLFQRRWGLASLQIDMAGAPAIGGPQLRDLPEATATELLQLIYERFQAHCRTQPSAL